MRILGDKCCAILIDVQQRLMPHIAEHERLEDNLVKLISGLNILDVPVIFSEQYTKGLGSTIPALTALNKRNSTFEKMVFSCADDKDIISELEKLSRPQILLCGIESHVCVLQTAIDLKAQPFEPIVVADCISSRSLEDKQFAILRMQYEGIAISSLEAVLLEICRESGTEKFKAISKLIK